MNISRTPRWHIHLGNNYWNILAHPDVTYSMHEKEFFDSDGRTTREYTYVSLVGNRSQVKLSDLIIILVHQSNQPYINVLEYNDIS